MGGYGGDGHISGGATYGSYSQPTNSGSGTSRGVYDYAWTNGAGGGAVKLVITNELRVDGGISANGTTNVDSWEGAGAGGSVWIVASNLTGIAAGSISANGGDNNTTSYTDGGGGGGRIALYLTNNAFNGAIKARGGIPRGSGYAAAGTIFVKYPSQANGTLLVDNNAWVVGDAAVTRLSSTNDTGSYALDGVTIRSNAVLALVAGQTLDVSGNAVPVAGDKSGWLINNGTFVLPVSHTISNYTLAHNGGATGLGGVLQYLTVASNGVLTHTSSGATNTYRLTLTVPNLTVNAGASVTADGLGFAALCGSGAGSGTLGATHAGIGYNNAAATYGTAIAPTNYGSGGGAVAGGGAIKLLVPGVLTVNGTISASGTTGAGSSGGGAGGSIWIYADTLSGSGNIRANAGVCTAGGGGGRVAVYGRRHSFIGLPTSGLHTNEENAAWHVSVAGGYHAGISGTEDGSVYIVFFGTTLMLR